MVSNASPVFTSHTVFSRPPAGFRAAKRQERKGEGGFGVAREACKETTRRDYAKHRYPVSGSDGERADVSGMDMRERGARALLAGLVGAAAIMWVVGTVVSFVASVPSLTAW